jgi:putative serine protease PepD
MRTVIAVAALLASAGAGAGVAAVAVHESDSGSNSTTVIRRPAVTVNAAPAASTSPSGGLSVGAIYRKTVPGVVEVLATTPTSNSGFFGGEVQSDQGTGFVVDSKGDIVTNYHVVASPGDSVRVRLHDGKVYGGRVIGRDGSKDVAVIRISAPASELHPLAFANSSAIHVGDSVVAIGDPYGLRNTATVGIVSALGRTIISPNGHKITGVIQTDAAINSGNSGGPLLNSQGQVIGVNSQIESGSQGGGSPSGNAGGNIGIGFSIPSNMVAATAHGLIQDARSHPYVGVELVTVSPQVAKATGMSAGVEIVSVTKGAPGDQAGLTGATGTKTVSGTPFSTGGDVVTKIDGTSVKSADQLIAQITQHKPGDQIQLTVVRNGHTSTITVTLGSD